MGNIVRKRIENFVKLFIGLGLLIFLANYVSPKIIIDTFKNAEVLYLILAILLVPFNLFLQFAKWKLLCKKYFNINSDRSIWLSLFYGILLLVVGFRFLVSGYSPEISRLGFQLATGAGRDRNQERT